MRFFDAHCDTVMRTFETAFDFIGGDRAGHLDLPRMLAAGHVVQLFAVFAPQSHYPGEDLRARAEETIRRIRGWAADSGGRLHIATTAAEIGQAVEQSPAERSVWGLIGLEGADPLEGQAANIEHFYRLGVRNVIPAWDDNGFSGTTFGSGGPLTAAGLELLERCEALGVMVDVSHLSDQAFWQVHSRVRKPFVASHSNCRSICGVGRNLTDEMIRGLAERGGVMGINLAPYFLSADYQTRWDEIMAPYHRLPLDVLTEDERKRIGEITGPALRAIPLPHLQWVGMQVLHAIQMGGEDCIGLGGDLDGISVLPAGIAGVEGYPLIYQELANAGLTPRQLDKVCWGNMARVYRAVIS